MMSFEREEPETVSLLYLLGRRASDLPSQNQTTGTDNYSCGITEIAKFA